MHPNIRSSRLVVSREKGVPKNLLNSQKNTYARVSFSFRLSSVISKVSIVDFENE